MIDDRRPKHLRVIDSAKEIQTKEERKKAAYEKRGNAQKAFYAQARINAVALERVIEALKASVILDDEGNIVIQWNDDMVEELIADIEDPGPRREN